MELIETGVAVAITAKVVEDCWDHWCWQAVEWGYVDDECWPTREAALMAGSDTVTAWIKQMFE